MGEAGARVRPFRLPAPATFGGGQPSRSGRGRAGAGMGEAWAQTGSEWIWADSCTGRGTSAGECRPAQMPGQGKTSAGGESANLLDGGGPVWWDRRRQVGGPGRSRVNGEKKCGKVRARGAREAGHPWRVRERALILGLQRRQKTTPPLGSSTYVIRSGFEVAGVRARPRALTPATERTRITSSAMDVRHGGSYCWRRYPTC
jgi:hypothetical protein